ncbi:MAG: hypothetical protein ACOYON_04410 [Fimbriimonas sp.]
MKNLRILILSVMVAVIGTGCSSGGAVYEPKIKGEMDANNVERRGDSVIVRDPGGDK